MVYTILINWIKKHKPTWCTFIIHLSLEVELKNPAVFLCRKGTSLSCSKQSDLNEPVLEWREYKLPRSLHQKLWLSRLNYLNMATLTQKKVLVWGWDYQFTDRFFKQIQHFKELLFNRPVIC